MAVVGTGEVVKKAVLEEGLAVEEEGKEGEKKEGHCTYNCKENAFLIDNHFKATPEQAGFPIFLIYFCRPSRGQGRQKGNGEDNRVQFKMHRCSMENSRQDRSILLDEEDGGKY